MRGRPKGSKDLAPRKTKAHLDLEGQRFRLLVVQRRIGTSKNGSVIWECLCDCGKTKNVLTNALRARRVGSCGCLLIVPDPAFSGLLGNYKGSAKSRGITWELTQEQFRKLTESPCYYTGREPSNIYTSVSSRNRTKCGLSLAGNDTYTYNGIDRLDSDKGYTLENCVPCCKDANLAKQSLSHDEFIALCKEIAARH
jgi:hypothetical protein